MNPDGLGALHLAFEQLQKKLAAEGLFDASRKRPIRRFPGVSASSPHRPAPPFRTCFDFVSPLYPLAG
jgi:exodeoxyribonuclease VII large subunit